MSRDRSLDEFFSASDDEDAGADEGDSGDNDERAASTPNGEDDEQGGDASEETAAATTPNDEEAVEAEVAEVGGRTEADGHDVKIDLPRPTYRWSPEGDECPICGTVVKQRWRDDDRFVCADCKEW